MSVELVGLGFTVSDAQTGQRLVANVVVRGGDDLNFTAGTCQEPADQGYVFCNVGRGRGTLTISKAGYKTLTVERDFPGEQNVPYVLERDTAPQPSRAERFDVRANFCNVWAGGHQDAPIFSALMGKYVEEGIADEVIADLVAAGSTHIVLSPESSYPGQGSFDWRDQPERFAALVAQISNTAGANGKALTPILFLDNGSANPKPRIDRYWPGIAAAIRREGVLDRCIVVPAWEPVKGDYTSAELSYALQKAHEWFPEAILGCHFSPTRWVGSSNPVEPDDPWHGGESDFYKSHGGEFIEIAFYQADADAVFTPNCDPTKDDCWLNRWYDGVIRLGRGHNGWRVVPICLSEGPAYSFIRGKSTPDMAREWATAGKKLAESEGVTVSYMNGLPW